jgi:hypothetical protein
MKVEATAGSRWVEGPAAGGSKVGCTPGHAVPCCSTQLPHGSRRVDARHARTTGAAVEPTVSIATSQLLQQGRLTLSRTMRLAPSLTFVQMICGVSRRWRGRGGGGTGRKQQKQAAFRRILFECAHGCRPDNTSTRGRCACTPDHMCAGCACRHTAMHSLPSPSPTFKRHHTSPPPHTPHSWHHIHMHRWGLKGNRARHAGCCCWKGQG